MKNKGEDAWKYLEGFNILGLTETSIDEKNWEKNSRTNSELGMYPRDKRKEGKSQGRNNDGYQHEARV